MTLGLHESRLRQRRRRRLAIIKWVFMLAVFAVLGFWAYRTGAFLAEREVRELRTEIDRLTAALVDVRQEREALAAGIEAARQREAEWQNRYRQDVPTGKAKEIFQLAQQRLAEGVSADRLAFVIGATDAKDNCRGKPDTRRFILPTANSSGGNDTIAFADGTIRITGEGQPAIGPSGSPHGYYDPGKPVTIRFIQLGGRTSEVSGELPLTHSVVQNKREYRFTIAAGDPRGFVYVTADDCAFP